MNEEALLQEQMQYYRDRAPEYDEWFRREGQYDRGPEHRRLWEEEVAMLRETLDGIPPEGEVLELACGTGLWTKELAKHDVAITAVDASVEALRLNEQKVPSPRVTRVHADLFNWAPSQSYDLIVFGFWLTHVPPSRFDRFWAWLEGCLADAGRVFFVDNKWYPGYTWRRPPGDAEEWVVRRRLNDGREYDIVKVLYEVEELRDRLQARGWTGIVSETPNFFLWGNLERAVAV